MRNLLLAGILLLPATAVAQAPLHVTEKDQLAAAVVAARNSFAETMVANAKVNALLREVAALQKQLAAEKAKHAAVETRPRIAP